MDVGAAFVAGVEAANAVEPGEGELDDELLAYVAAQPDLSLMAVSALQDGAFVRDDRPLAHQYQSLENLARLGRLRELAAQAGVTPNQLALAWLLRGTPPVIRVLGVSSVAQLDEALGAYGAPVDTIEELNRSCVPAR